MSQTLEDRVNHLESAMRELIHGTHKHLTSAAEPESGPIEATGRAADHMGIDLSGNEFPGEQSTTQTAGTSAPGHHVGGGQL